MDKSGYPKWGVSNTSTVPNDPANEINRAKDEPQKAAPGVEFNRSENTKTINDGTTDVVTNVLRNQNLQTGSLPEAKQHYAPCINPSCKSYGKSHPNCLCYAGPGGTSLEDKTGWMPGYGPGYAHGGQICSGPHKENCEHYEHPQETLDHAVLHHGLLHALTKTGYSKSENPMKPSIDHREASIRGQKQLDSHIKNLFEKDHRIKPDHKNIQGLKEYLTGIEAHPEALLDVGGNIDPSNSSQIGALAATSTQYLNGLKPKRSQMGPLDAVTPNAKKDEETFDRHLGVAEHPLSIVNHVKDGTLLPSDMATLKALYPKLAAKIASQGFEELVAAKEKGKELPYKQKQALSLLLGQPLDSTMSPMSMQAIIHANGAQQAQLQSKNQPGKPKKASGVELKEIDKVTKLYETPLQARQMDRKS